MVTMSENLKPIGKQVWEISHKQRGGVKRMSEEEEEEEEYSPDCSSNSKVKGVFILMIIIT